MKIAIKSLPNSMGNKKRGRLIIIAALLFILAPNLALAVPNLQIYIPGATYDTDTETWVMYSYDYQLWVIGAHLDVNDVKFAAAVPTDEDGSIQVTWHTPSSPDYGGKGSEGFALTFLDPDLGTDLNRLDYYEAYRDSYATGDPDPATYGFGSGAPLDGDGAQIPPHGVFPTDFYEYFIGDFGTGETVQNYIPGDEWGDTAAGEIKKFDVLVSGYSWVNLMAYDHVIIGSNNAKYVFTPFSHDGASAPEPATMLLLGTGLIGLGWFGRRKKDNS